jgi:FixJ family two-component response regulator
VVVKPAAKPALIVIIDDDHAVRAALADLVAAAGYDAAAFASAEDFLHAPEAETFDCLISDVQLPGLSGWSLLAALKARPSSKPVILITARLDLDGPGQALEAGAACFFHKPFAAEALLECVESNLPGRRA